MTITLATDRQAFAADRKPILSRGEEFLKPVVTQQLRRFHTPGWTKPIVNRATMLYRRTYRDESGRQVVPSDTLAQFGDMVTSNLQHVTQPTAETLDEQASGIAASIATAAINAAQVSAGQVDDEADDLMKVWLSMDDDRVRHTHKIADGQAVALDEAFSVGGESMDFPGDMSASVEEWMNCRCLLGLDHRRNVEQHSLAAAAKDQAQQTGMGIFLIPNLDDDVHTVSSEELAHMTVLWFGNSDEASPDLDAIKEAAQNIAATIPPFTEKVEGRDTLGDDGADVLMMSRDYAGPLRDMLIENSAIRDAVDAVEQHPSWLPHVTVGYPDSPAQGEPPEEITFDRVDLWVGPDHYEFPLGGDMPTDQDKQDQQDVDLSQTGDAPIPWHGVLAPEGIVSGDKRKFAVGSMTWRDLPLPLSWQKVNAEGHDGSVVVGRIDEIWRDGEGESALLRAKGVFLSTAEANEAVGMMSEGGLRGVSVDVDMAVAEFQNEDGSVPEESDDLMEALFGDDDSIMVLTSGRVSGATLCAIPAFMEAQLALGEDASQAALTAACQCELAIDEGPWDGSSGKYSDQQWYDATIIHLATGADKLVKSNNKLPILTPSGSLSRAGVHAAASRLNQTDAPPDKISSAKAALRSAYSELGEEPPDNIKATLDEIEQLEAMLGFVKTEDGPGWLTHPVDTDRLRDYWVHGEGAAKIGWGTPGDFNRCRAELAKYVKPMYLSGYCANRHYDALGFWPGRPVSVDEVIEASAAAWNLVASAAGTRPPREWFEDPHLPDATPLTVTEEGRVFGHLAEWGTCHIGFSEQCVTAPPSASNYAYFNTGAVATDRGDVAVGHLTLGTGHAGKLLRYAEAVAHYDNTGTVVADVAAGEDSHGIWVAGWVRPGTTPEQVYALKASAISGDWRNIGGVLELCAALCVNVPGFPLERTALAASGGRQVSLVAAGVVDTANVRYEPMDPEAIADAVIARLDARENRKVRKSRMSALAASAHRDPKSKMAALKDRLGRE